MFKSARYYFRKKVENVEETPRKKYISLSPIFLEQIDIYISERLSSPANSSPADLYCDFCQNKKELIFEQIQELIDLTSEEICIKLKKTFKNRFYVLKASIQSRATEQ
jgi:CRISPR/Cas system-associated protein Cas10 (large subunit of type III CRISPR-Cas system)